MGKKGKRPPRRLNDTEKERIQTLRDLRQFCSSISAREKVYLAADDIPCPSDLKDAPIAEIRRFFENWKTEQWIKHMATKGVHLIQCDKCGLAVVPGEHECVVTRGGKLRYRKGIPYREVRTAAIKGGKIITRTKQEVDLEKAQETYQAGLEAAGHNVVIHDPCQRTLAPGEDSAFVDDFINAMDPIKQTPTHRTPTGCDFTVPKLQNAPPSPVAPLVQLDNKRPRTEDPPLVPKELGSSELRSAEIRPRAGSPFPAPTYVLTAKGWTPSSPLGVSSSPQPCLFPHSPLPSATRRGGGANHIESH